MKQRQLDGQIKTQNLGKKQGMKEKRKEKKNSRTKKKRKKKKEKESKAWQGEKQERKNKKKSHNGSFSVKKLSQPEKICSGLFISTWPDDCEGCTDLQTKRPISYDRMCNQLCVAAWQLKLVLCLILFSIFVRTKARFFHFGRNTWRRQSRAHVLSVFRFT